MPITNNNIKLIDVPIWQSMQPLPTTSAAGASIALDRTGSARYVYILLSATSFWRYDTYANTYQQLANPPGGTFGAGTCMVYDPSKDYVWALITSGTGAPTWQYYNCATNTWTARSVANLAATFGTDGSLCHPCTSYSTAPPASDEFIYLVGNAATAFYIYNITANTWAVGTPVTAAPGAGCGLHWSGTYDINKIICIRGGATATVYEYNISTPAWATKTIMPATETFTTGTMSFCPTGLGKIYIQKDNTMRIYELNLTSNALTPVATQYMYASGTAHVGDRFAYVKETNEIAFLYVGLHTSAYWVRTPLINYS